MMQWLEWFTRWEDTKPVGLVIFFVTFVGIVWYVYLGASKGRLESYKNMPFLDDETVDNERTENNKEDKQ